MEARDYEYNGQKMTEYEATQKQRYIERQIRKWKREYKAMEAAGLPTEEASTKITSWQAAQKDYLEKTGLKRQYDREQTAKWNRSAGSKASSKSRKHYKAWINSITQEGAPRKLADYYDMKYNDPNGYALLQGYAKAVEKGDISPLIGFDQYQSVAQRIEDELVGRKTIAGTEIIGYVPHFVDRIIGQVAEPHKYKRTGVSIEKAKDALLHGKAEPWTLNKGNPSQRYLTAECIVSVNPETGILVQVNPR